MSPSPPRAPAPDAGADVPADGLAERLEAALAGIERVDPALAARVHELIGGLLEMYGEGLARILALLRDAGEAAEPLRRRLAGDEVVASLLLIHDLYPVPLRERVEQALARARPYVESHGGELALLGLEGGVARIRLAGTCERCPSSQTTLDGLLREALAAEAPDLAGVEWVGARPAELLRIEPPGPCLERMP